MRAATYRDVVTHPVAGRLALVGAISSLGDFVGLGVLILLAYQRSGGSATATALLFAVQAVPALLVGTLAGPHLARLAPRVGLVCGALVGAAALLLVLATSGLWPLVLAAAVLGGVRAVTMPLRSGLLAAHVPPQLRTPALSIDQVFFQLAQVVGFLTGGMAAVGGAATAALVFDLVTFLVAAVVFTGLPPAPAAAAGQPLRRPADGLRVAFSHPVARAIVPAVWAVLAVGAVPESMAPALVSGYWVAPVMVAAPACSAAAAWWLGRQGWLEDLDNTLRLALLAPAAMATTGLAAAAGWGPLAILSGHAALGIAGVWIVGAQAVLARTVPARDIVQLAAAMSAALLILEGVGALVVGALVDLAGPLAGYGAPALVTAVPVLLAWRHRPTRREVADAARLAEQANRDDRAAHGSARSDRLAGR